MTPLNSPPPPLSSILLSHFPYLSLYSPFVTSFPAAISSLTTLLFTNSQFASFVARQEADPRCGKLKLRDWLLTIVQRCPRYLLLLKDLINCTEVDDPEHAQLVAVHTLVAKSKVSYSQAPESTLTSCFDSHDLSQYLPAHSLSDPFTSRFTTQYA
jgi:hypothetical protein